ncbi:hypothetical protein D9611_012544 [Ephemerocybe angulata]|uniref:Uncharacterized protein n=1 Tax=Ephemerocybe angulata TaxID=980116 RepID=A0A8H5AUS1_9AGAR|nr:hypothetical protein D9611_012544 [Tulosesus angulatus]
MDAVAVNDLLARTPELYLLALAQFAIAADTEVMRSFSLILLRRLLFHPHDARAAPPALALARTVAQRAQEECQYDLQCREGNGKGTAVAQTFTMMQQGEGAGSILLADDVLPPSPSSSSPLLYPSPPPSPFRTEPACWVGYTGDTREIGRRFDGPADWRLLLGSGGRRRPHHRSTSTPIQFTPTHRTGGLAFAAWFGRTKAPSSPFYIHTYPVYTHPPSTHTPLPPIVSCRHLPPRRTLNPSPTPRHDSLSPPPRHHHVYRRPPLEEDR